MRRGHGQGRRWDFIGRRSWVLVCAIWIGFAAHRIAGAQDGGDARQLKAEGIRLLRSGEAEAAKQQLDRAIALAPADADALTWRGIAESQLAQNDAAAGDFLRALKLNNGLISARYNLALSLIRLHQNDGAIDELRLVVAAQPGAPEPVYNLGILLAGKGLAAEAATAFASAHALRPEDGAITLHLLQAQLAAGERTTLQQLLHELGAPTVAPELQQQAGVALLQAGDAVDAVSLLRTASNHGSATPESHLLLVRAMMTAGRGAEVLAMEQESYDRDRTPARALALARVLLANDRAEQVIPLLRGLPDGATDEPQRDCLLGIALAATHAVPEAIVSLERAIAADAALPLAESVLGFCLYAQGEYARAAMAYGRASDLDPKQALYARDAAVAYERANQGEQGLRYAERANAQDAGSAGDRVLLGKLLLRAGRQQEAIPQLREAAAMNPDLDAADYLLARTYAQLGQRQEAAVWASRLSELKQRHEATFRMQKQASAPASSVRSSSLLQGGALDSEQAVAP